MWYSIAGIIFVFVGTAFSLWSIITKDIAKAETWEAVKDAGADAKKEKKKVITGIILILVGSILQIIGIVR